MVVNFPFGSPQTENINLTEKNLEATLKEPSQDKVKVKQIFLFPLQLEYKN